jgi:hypothetical protein
MLWNELSYEMQKKVYDRIERALLQETDPEVQDAIVSAMTELEHWDNSSCLVQEVDGKVDHYDPLAPVQAQDPILCCDCKIPWFCRCYCHKKEQ